jgi:hypothetical protein
MPELWVPGAGGPSVEDFVERLHKVIASYAQEHELAEASVEVELADGSTLGVKQISPEPGYGFITVRPHPEEGEAVEDVIVPIGGIRRVTIAAAEERRARFGFSIPESA